MKNPTPTNASGNPKAGANGTENAGSVEVADATPKIDMVTIEGSGKFSGTPEEIEVTITYTTDSDGVMDLQSTLTLSVDEGNVAHIEEIEGDGTMAEWFIPMMYVKQELTQQHPAIVDVAGVPSFGVVHDQLYDNQPQFNDEQPQLEASSGGSLKEPTQNNLPEGEGNESTSGDSDEADAPSETEAVKNGSSGGESQAEQDNSDGDDESTTEDDSDTVEVEVEDADAYVDTGESEDADLSPESLIQSEDSDWVVDDTSGEGNILATIKNEVTECTMAVWDFRDEDDFDKNYTLNFYDDGESKQLGFDKQENIIKRVEKWKVDPPKVS